MPAQEYFQVFLSQGSQSIPMFIFTQVFTQTFPSTASSILRYKKQKETKKNLKNQKAR